MEKLTVKLRNMSYFILRMDATQNEKIEMLGALDNFVECVKKIVEKRINTNKNETEVKNDDNQSSKRTDKS